MRCITVGLADDNARNSEDFPTFGAPTKHAIGMEGFTTIVTVDDIAEPIAYDNIGVKRGLTIESTQ
jgi:hypothetical protein